MGVWSSIRYSGSRAGHIEILSKLLVSMDEGLQLLPSKLRVISMVSSCGNLLKLNKEHFQITCNEVSYPLVSMFGIGPELYIFKIKFLHNYHLPSG